jgi:glycosyltransferase involved in cell wall biosynthesis
MKKEKPKVSIIISTYNRRDLLKRAIKSALNQSFDNLEVIVVDDCSTDKTEELVKNYMALDDRVRYFKTKVNCGFDSKPKNIGISKAKGDYVMFLDDDDFQRRDAVKILLKYIETTKCDVAYGDYLIGRKGEQMKPGWSVNFQASLLTQMNYIAMVAVMVKRQALLDVGGFDEDVPKFKDWNLWLRLQKNGCSFIHIGIIMAEVLISDRSISHDVKNDVDEEGKYKPTYFNPADCLIYPENTSLGKAKEKKVAIFTLTLNRLEYTKQMYEAMKKTAGYDFDWFVIDQASTDGTKEWLTSVNCKLKVNSKNVGIAEGWNQAIELIRETGDYDIVIKVDNDAELMTIGWLKTMVEIFRRNNRVILSPYVEGLEDTPGGVIRQRLDGELPYSFINDNVLGMVRNLGGICFASPIGLYDDFKFPNPLQGNKDYYLSLEANNKGYHLFYVEELRVWHIDGTQGQKKKYPTYFKELYGVK